MDSNIPNVVHLMFHDGCSRPHGTRKEVSKCPKWTGEWWVNNSDITMVTYTIKEERKL